MYSYCSKKAKQRGVGRGMGVRPVFNLLPVIVLECSPGNTKMIPGAILSGANANNACMPATSIYNLEVS